MKPVMVAGAPKIQAADAQDSASRPALPAGSSPAEQAVVKLRQMQAVLPSAAVLRAAGGCLIFAGLLWVALRFLRANLYIFLILAGVVCIAASLVTDPDGLLCKLPQGVQDFVLRGTVFDFFHDDVAFTNFSRKWGRVQLLALLDGHSEGDVDRIIKTMDPEFVELVFRRNIISFLPKPLVRLLLPEAAFALKPAAAASQDAPEHDVGPAGNDDSCCSDPSERADLRVPVSRRPPAAWPLMAQVEACASTVLRQPALMLTAAAAALGPPEPDLVPWISQLLKKKNEEKELQITEPELMPLVKRTMGFETALKKSGRMFMHIVKGLSASAATGWVLSAGLLYFGAGSRLLVRGLAAGGLMSRTPDDQQVAKASRLATAVSLLGAGAAVFLSAYATRLAQLWEDSPSSYSEARAKGKNNADPISRLLVAGEQRPFEPEREESPAESEAATE